jgi:hypothetical protein
MNYEHRSMPLNAFCTELTPASWCWFRKTTLVQQGLEVQNETKCLVIFGNRYTIIQNLAHGAWKCQEWILWWPLNLNPIDPLKLDQCISTGESSSENEFWNACVSNCACNQLPNSEMWERTKSLNFFLSHTYLVCMCVQQSNHFHYSSSTGCHHIPWETSWYLLHL